MRDKKIYKLSLYAMLTAIMILMTVFPAIGYLKIGPVQITFMMIPVTVGCMLLGPNGGAFLGGVFGATSFIQCFIGDPFGAALLGINPIFTAILCFIPRILMGYICGFIFIGLQKIDKTNFLSFAITSLSGALLNTTFFVGTLILLFGRSEYIISQFGATVLKVISAFITVNGLVEAIACMIIGTAISKALFRFIKNKNIN